MMSVHMARVTSEKQMVADDEDLPTAYLLFAVAAIIVIGVTAAGAFIILILTDTYWLYRANAISGRTECSGADDARRGSALLISDRTDVAARS